MKQIRWGLSLAVVATTMPLCVALFAVRQAPAAQAAPLQLPAGPGRDQFQKTCSGCHALTVVTVQHKSADDWAGVVDEMRTRGANGTDDDFIAIVGYLATNFGTAPVARVNVNAAAADALASGLSLTPQEADAIVVFRNGKGPFKDIAGLEKVPGVDAAKIEAAKDRIDF